MSENTISNTRLLSLIVALSVVALSFVLSGSNNLDAKQLGVSNKPVEMVVNTSSTVYEKKPVKRATMKFSVNPDAMVLSI